MPTKKEKESEGFNFMKDSPAGLIELGRITGDGEWQWNIPELFRRCQEEWKILEATPAGIERFCSTCKLHEQCLKIR